jgi:hypothetical protein
MNIRLTPLSEKLLQEQLAHGPYNTPEEVIERALETLAEMSAAHFTLGPPAKGREEAVADILELRKGVKLGGLKITDLIHEGHKY